MEGPTQHILIVDDEQFVSSVLKRTLEAGGYEVTAVSNGIDAIETLKDITPDLIMLDIKMPGLNGYETLDRIRKTHENIPVIMLTAVMDAESVEKSLSLGADDYIRKPFRPSEVIARVKAKLRRANG